MQTFVPHPSFAESARVLDDVRLKNQTNECLAIMQALDKGTGWIHHPATKMWVGYEAVFCLYAFDVCVENERRGFLSYADPGPFLEFHSRLETTTEMPWWVGRTIFHATHMNALQWKKPWHYGIPLAHPVRLAYVWPVNATQTFRLSEPDQKRIAKGDCLNPFDFYDAEDTTWPSM